MKIVEAPSWRLKAAGCRFYPDHHSWVFLALFLEKQLFSGINESWTLNVGERLSNSITPL